MSPADFRRHAAANLRGQVGAAGGACGAARRDPGADSRGQVGDVGGASQDATADIAVVIPVLGDVTPLRTLLERMADWACRPREVIVVAAGQDARPRALCKTHGCRCLTSAICRGKQLDAGARAARTSVLWFLHADAEARSSSLGEIALAIARGVEGGHFRFRFSGPRMRRKMLIERFTNLRVGLGGIPYGDQGIFVRRDVYLACGGFPHQPLFEEVALVRKLRARGRFRALATPLGVSPRRWERDGWIRRCLKNRGLALAHGCGQDAHRLAGRYELPGRRSTDAGESGVRA